MLSVCILQYYSDTLLVCCSSIDIGPECCCRAMPLAVLGSVSEQEAEGLGKLQEKQARQLTGTMITGSDLSVHGDSGWSFWNLIVSRTGQSFPQPFS